MNHYEQGLRAYEARRFHEALIHFEKVSSDGPSEELTKTAEYIYACAKVTAPEKSWRYLRILVRRLRDEKRWHDVLAILEREESCVPELHKDFLLGLRADAFFHGGELERSRLAAIAHVDLLLKKKVYHRLIEAAQTYEARFPYVLYFMFLEFEAHLALADYEKTNAVIGRIVKSCRRRWPKLEDAEHATKAGLLETLLSALQAEELASGEAVLQAHYLALELCLLTQRTPAKEDWKKALELIVFADSWTHLKCVLELALMAGEAEIAQHAYQRLKAKKGYSFVKLTRHDPHLKKWILGAPESDVSAAPEEPLVTAADLQLDTPQGEADGSQALGGPLVDFDDEQEVKAIELNAIKQLELHEISPDLALDLVVTYQTLGFHRVVDWILVRAQTFEGLPHETQRKFQYLRVIHAIGKNQTYLALTVLEEMLGSPDLGLDEFKELKYAQGNIYLRLGDAASARRCFGEVHKLDPGYRQLAERMTSLEAN